MTPPTKKPTHRQRLDYHGDRLLRLSDHDSMLAFHHFLGALGAMCEPKSPWNPGPTREALVLALERAVNSQTGT